MVVSTYECHAPQSIPSKARTYMDARVARSAPPNTRSPVSLKDAPRPAGRRRVSERSVNGKHDGGHDGAARLAFAFFRVRSSSITAHRHEFD